ncbi:MAG: thiolase domain-containing protein [Acidimicrobiales bacterium]
MNPARLGSSRDTDVYVAGVFEHPRREIPELSTPRVHAEVASGALADAGLSFSDVDGYLCDGSQNYRPVAFGVLSMADYLGLRCTYLDSTETGGSAPVVHVAHAAAAIAAGRCQVALVTSAGRPRSAPTPHERGSAEGGFEDVWGMSGAVTGYALSAQRHMHEFGTTSSQLAEVKVAASLHAQHNPNAFLRDLVSVAEVLESPMVSSPLHRLDCCVVTDGGGACVLVSGAVARQLSGRCVKVLGSGEAARHSDLGRLSLTSTAAAVSGPRAFAAAGVAPGDIDYVSLYDSFTITVVETIEDLGFCEKGEGGRFVTDGALVAPHGRLPYNTDGGGMCNNHPGNRGGITKVVEAVRQLRGEATPAVQVPDCELALVNGTGGNVGTRMGSATLILGRRDT